MCRCRDVPAHDSNASRLNDVGGAARNTLLPLTTWYQTALPPKSKCQSVYASGGVIRA